MSKDERIIRDPLYDYICYPKDGVISELVDSPEFQRLRMIRQLGLASQVFPNAEHSRLSHSLGCYHLAKTFAQVLGEKDNKELDIAALLHDIGHLPLSHTLEKTVFPVKHEDVTVDIIKGGTRVNEILETHGISPKLVADLIKRPSNPQYLHRLISSQLDVDRFDYLRRDSYFTGNPCGFFDIERIMRTVEVVSGDLRVPPKGVRSVENYLISRYSMYYQVYLHKTKVCCEQMMISTMRRAKEILGDGSVKNPTLFERFLMGENIGLAGYNHLTDNDVYYHLQLWSGHPDKVLSGICKAILYRRLFKAVNKNNERIKIGAVVSNMDKIRKLIAKEGFDPDYHFLLFEGSVGVYSPYSPDKDDQDNAILTTENEDIGNVIPLPKRDQVTHVFVPEKCRPEITKIIMG